MIYINGYLYTAKDNIHYCFDSTHNNKEILKLGILTNDQIWAFKMRIPEIVSLAPSRQGYTLG